MLPLAYCSIQIRSYVEISYTDCKLRFWLEFVLPEVCIRVGLTRLRYVVHCHLRANTLRYTK